MTIKAGYANGNVHNKTIKKKRCRRREKRIVSDVPMGLQRLFMSCREVFKGLGTVPSPTDVQNMCRILGIFSSESAIFLLYIRISIDFC